MSSRAERVYPRDCSFLLTIPIRREDFLDDIRTADKDFLIPYRGTGRSEEAEWLEYRSTASEVEAFLGELRRQGVGVVPRATLHDWKRAQETSKVIVLFAHWRNGLVRLGEVRWAEFEALRTAAASEDGVVERMRRIAVETSGDRAKAVEQINLLLVHGQLGRHPWFGQEVNQKRASPEHWVYMNRRFLEAALPGVFGRSTSVEFAEGFVGIDQVSANVLADYRGVFDLSVCNSILLGELINTNAVHCLPVATRLPATVAFRLIFYRALFELLREGRPYVPTIVDLRRRLVEGL
jgi:hypothetical protein